MEIGERLCSWGETCADCGVRKTYSAPSAIWYCKYLRLSFTVTTADSLSVDKMEYYRTTSQWWRVTGRGGLLVGRIFCFSAPLETKIYVWTPRNLICTFGPEARRHRLWRRGNTARRHRSWRHRSWRRARKYPPPPFLSARFFSVLSAQNTTAAVPDRTARSLRRRPGSLPARLAAGRPPSSLPAAAAAPPTDFAANGFRRRRPGSRARPLGVRRRRRP
jgi:hypothetical protein